jgi:hypothetical protein
MRKALAGVNYLKGMSDRQALLQAGYASSTAHTPRKNNLHAEPCIAEAVKAGLVPSSGSLAADARRLLQKKLRSMLDEGHLKANEVARIVAVTEKYHGRGEESRGDGCSPRTFVERARWVAAVLAELQRRGLPRGGEVVDVEPVAQSENGG